MTSHLPLTSYLDFVYQAYLQVGFRIIPLLSKSDSLTVEPITPSDAVILPDPLRQELVIFTGYPCSGKSSFYHQHFSPAGYTHINQDTLGSRPKCVKAAEEALKAGKSVAVGMYTFLFVILFVDRTHTDNTNRDVKTRKHYLDLAKKHKVRAR